MNLPQADQLPFELVALSRAIVYQQAIFKLVSPFVGQRVLELGAGIGNMSKWFQQADRLILTEVDPALLELLKKCATEWRTTDSQLSIQALDISTQTFQYFEHDNLDTIISFNVLEHIENHDFVLKNAANLLRQSNARGKKRIVTFVPAHNWAYGVMDKAVGHCRRYNTNIFKTLHQDIMPDASLTLIPFNFVGLVGWTINGKILRRTSAGEGMIKLVEKIWPLTELIDDILINKLGIKLGQSLLAVHEFN